MLVPIFFFICGFIFIAYTTLNKLLAIVFNIIFAVLLTHLEFRVVSIVISILLFPWRYI